MAFTPNSEDTMRTLSPAIAFLIVSFSLGELGDGLNIFQGIYLVAIGWKEGAVGIALSMMGFTALIVQTFAGDWVDKTSIDRRIFLSAASIITALSASMIFFVQGNSQHYLIYVSKVIEGISSSFINPCLSALVLATFGPNHFDVVMASNTLWGHIGSVVAAALAGLVAYLMYPNIKICFMVIAVSALSAIFFIGFLPEGDKLMGRGFLGKHALDKYGNKETLEEQTLSCSEVNGTESISPTAASYWEVMSDRRCFVLCITGFFFHFANANVLLVLGELMGGDNGEDGAPSRSAIPLIAGAIVLAQVTMAIATWVGDRLTQISVGRRPIVLAGIISLPIRCFLIIYWKDAGDTYLLSTQILDGLGGGFLGLMHPYIVADATFGTGRFNVVMGLTASSYGFGATLSNLIGQHIVEIYGHVISLLGSLIISVIPILIFFFFMPETLGNRGANNRSEKKDNTALREGHHTYVEMKDGLFRAL
mmetsp:Transcript_33011/g.36795  ORF Transcript_33011/g.36795 Transcript_33011/m.36795 type:complete len:479 (-) Transcript_33011:148-1584(-)